LKTYEYSGFTTEGKSAKGLIEADGLKEAREKLVSTGILAEKVAVSDRTVRMDTGTRAAIYRELSELLAAGLPVDKALEIMMRASESNTRGVFLARVRDGVREGGALSSAFASVGNNIGRFEQAMIEAAEKSSALELMLTRLADFLEEREELQDKIQAALIYPMMILTIGTCAAILMLGVLIPKTVEALGSETVKLPKITLLVMAFGSFISRWGWLLFTALGSGVAYLVWRIRKDEDFAVKWDRFLFRLPVFGKGYRIVVCQRFTKTMAILLEGGVSIIDAMILSGRATGSRWIAGLCAEQAEEVRHGVKLSEAIKMIPVLSESIAEWVAVGETTGGLERMTARAGDRYSRMWDSYMAKALGILEPVILIIVGGFVLLITLSVLMPVISMSRMIGE
jgi:general secretion pathway protein F